MNEYANAAVARKTGITCFKVRRFSVSHCVTLLTTRFSPVWNWYFLILVRERESSTDSFVSQLDICRLRVTSLGEVE